MNNKPVILVCGAGGHIGKAISRNLVNNPRRTDYIIRLAVRPGTMHKIKEFQGKEGVDCVEVDCNNKEALLKAMKNFDRVWATAPNPSKEMKAFDRINFLLNVIDCAKQSGVKFFLLGSVIKAETESTTFAKEFRSAEKRLEQSGISYCIFRSIMFAENIIGFREELTKGQLPVPAHQASFPPISMEDIGLAAATVLLNPEPHRNKVYTLTGPESLSIEQQTQVLSKVLGRQVKYVDVEPKQIVEKYKSMGMPDYQAQGMLELWDMVQKGMVKDPSPDFKKITGQDPTRFETVVQRLKERGLLEPTHA